MLRSFMTENNNVTSAKSFTVDSYCLISHQYKLGKKVVQGWSLVAHQL